MSEKLNFFSMVRRHGTQLILVLWAGPYTLIGLILGVFGLATGGGMRIHYGIVEFHGGVIRRLLRLLAIQPTAMTLGHVVIGRDAKGLDQVRKHELVHVRQYERWGPLFGPAYLSSSLVLWMLGREPYRENPFEKQAVELSDS